MRAVAAALSVLAGVAVGPVLALLADRIPERKPLADGGIRSPEMVPITIVSAALFGAFGLRFGGDSALPAFLVFAACLVVITVTDLRLFLIPNRIIYPTLAAGAVLLTIAAAIGNDWEAWRRAGIGGAAAWLALLVMHLINPRGMAFGDVRLAAVIGMYTGWLGYDHIVLGLFSGFVAAALIGGVLIITKRRTAKDPVPFGPFLALGATIAVLFGTTLIHWYRGG
jgi:leader peptidase (prepilin peptidase)/N-methyltransferase